MNLKTIAERAGVSTATVSNVINGNYHKVSKATRAKVEAIIEETDYKPNVIARSLATKESRIIGLVVPYIGENQTFLANPYNAHLVAELEQIVRKHDYYLMIRSVSQCKEILPMLSSWNTDGAIFLGVMDEEVDEINCVLKSPKVFLDTYVTGDKQIANVGIDDYRGGYLSARYLISKGHQRLALVSPDKGGGCVGVISERYRGFKKACEENGIDFNEERDVFLSDSVFGSAIETGQNIAFSDGHYTGVSVMSDIVAAGVIEGLIECGLKVPEDVSVVGFDNLPECDQIRPKLATIGQNFNQKARKACDLLFAQIAGDEDAFTKNIVLPIRIVERQSVRDISED